MDLFIIVIIYVPFIYVINCSNFLAIMKLSPPESTSTLTVWSMMLTQTEDTGLFLFLGLSRCEAVRIWFTLNRWWITTHQSSEKDSETQRYGETWSTSSKLETLIIVFGPVASKNSVPVNRSVLYEHHCSQVHIRTNTGRKMWAFN